MENFGVRKSRPGQMPGRKARCKKCINDLCRTLYYPYRAMTPKVKEEIQPVTDKRCRTCGDCLPITEFSPQCKEPIREHHWLPHCKECFASKHRGRKAAGYKKPRGSLALRMWESKAKNVKMMVHHMKGTNASRRHQLEFTLTVANIQAIIDAQTTDGVLRCAATGVALEDIKAMPLSPSLDRIDCGGGYTPENVRVVALLYNLARRKWDDGQVLSVIRAMAKGS